MNRAKWVSCLLLAFILVSMPLSNVTASIETEHYTTSETILTDLSYPAILEIDAFERIYFSEWDESSKTLTLKRYDPTTSEVIEIISQTLEYSTSPTVLLDLDGDGNIYYMISNFTYFEIYKIQAESVGTGESELLYLTVGHSVSMTVDWLGNLYFFQQPSRGEPPAKLMMIPGKTKDVKVLLELDANFVVGLQASPYLNQGVFFAAKFEDDVYLYQFKSGELITLLKKPAENHGFIAYTALDFDGDLYYLYRQRADKWSSEQWGYLEIGKFSITPLEIKGPEILLSEFYTDKGVWIFYGGEEFLGVYSLTEDVFATVLFWNGTHYTETLLWLNRLTETYKALVESQPQIFTFVVDYHGNIYYAAWLSGVMIRINR